MDPTSLCALSPCDDVMMCTVKKRTTSRNLRSLRPSSPRRENGLRVSRRHALPWATARELRDASLDPALEYRESTVLR